MSQATSIKKFLSHKLPEDITLQAEEKKTILVDKPINTTIHLGRGSQLTFILFATEGWNETAKITFEFDGEESEVQFLGFVIGKEKHSFPFETISKHLAPNTKAHYLLRAAMFDHSHIDYKGTIIVDKHAQLTDTYLGHHTLLLSDFARARTIPALEIEADDVKAGHAASLGKVDEELMFYLKSRGLTTKEAEQMLITGFFESDLQKIEDPALQDDLRHSLLHLLPEAITS